MDDYHPSPDGTVQISERCPAFYSCGNRWPANVYREGPATYRRAGDVTVQYKQALYHAQAQDRARAWPRMSGGCDRVVRLEQRSPNNSQQRGRKNPASPTSSASLNSARQPTRRRSILPCTRSSRPTSIGTPAPAAPAWSRQGRSHLFSNCDRLGSLSSMASPTPPSTRPQGLPQPSSTRPSSLSRTLDGGAHPELRPELRVSTAAGGHLALSRPFLRTPARTVCSSSTPTMLASTATASMPLASLSR